MNDRDNIELAEEIGILSRERMREHVPESWKLVWTQEQKTAIEANSLPIINRRDEVLGPVYLAWTTKEVYDAIKLYESKDSVANLSLIEFLGAVFGVEKEDTSF